MPLYRHIATRPIPVPLDTQVSAIYRSCHFFASNTTIPSPFPGEDGCLEEFENTAAFSRDYQASQDCMCDSEHMFDCPARDFQSAGSEMSNEIDLDRIMEELSVDDQHKNLVAKKFYSKKVCSFYFFSLPNENC